MSEVMLHTVLIYGHALGGLVAFSLGCFVLRPQSRGQAAVFRAYLFALWMMVLLLVAALGVTWHDLSGASRLAYSALGLLALYTGVRGTQAQRLRHTQTPGWPGAYIGHVGFTLISLFDGFVIVGALDLGAPGWLVGTVGVVGVLVGIRAINVVEGRAVRCEVVGAAGTSVLGKPMLNQGGAS